MSNLPTASALVNPGPPTPAKSEDYKSLKEQFDSVVTSDIGKLAVALTALAVPLLTGLCAWLQKELGVKLDPAELATFIATMGAGIVITGYKWIANRGDWERSIVDAYGVYLTGQTATTHQVVVVSGATSSNGAGPSQPALAESSAGAAAEEV